MDPSLAVRASASQKLTDFWQGSHTCAVGWSLPRLGLFGNELGTLRRFVVAGSPRVGTAGSDFICFFSASEDKIPFPLVAPGTDFVLLRFALDTSAISSASSSFSSFARSSAINLSTRD